MRFDRGGEVRGTSPGVRGTSLGVRGAALGVLLLASVAPLGTSASARCALSDRQSGIGQSGIGQSGIGRSGIGQSGIGESVVGRSEIEIGRKVYAARKCMTCHMVAGKGNMRFPLDGIGARLSPGDLGRWLTDTAEMEGALPRQPAVRMSEWMKTNRKLTDADRDALVAYLASLK